MILPIYLYGQPVLRKQAEEIEQTPELKQFIADMYETLTEGCGLAAPQVGKPWRLFVVDGSELAEDYPECKDFKRAFINPEILEESEETCTYSEGCLSLPGISENVVRPATIKIWMRIFRSMKRRLRAFRHVSSSMNMIIWRVMCSPIVSHRFVRRLPVTN